jgi:hypothetical protein
MPGMLEACTGSGLGVNWNGFAGATARVTLAP